MGLLDVSSLLSSTEHLTPRSIKREVITCERELGGPRDGTHPLASFRISSNMCSNLERLPGIGHQSGHISFFRFDTADIFTAND